MAEKNTDLYDFRFVTCLKSNVTSKQDLHRAESIWCLDLMSDSLILSNQLDNFQIWLDNVRQPTVISSTEMWILF